MTQYNILNVKLSNHQLNKLKSRIKSGTEGTLNLSSNVTGDLHIETDFPHKPLSTKTQVLRLSKAFANNSSANINLSKTQRLYNQDMISRSKNIYINKLEDIVNKYNNTYHSTKKMKSVDIKSTSSIRSDKNNNKEDPKSKVGDHVRISKIGRK